MTSPNVHLDESAAPHYELRIEGALDTVEVRRLLRLYQRIHQREERFTVLTDVRNAKRPSAEVNRMLANFTDDTRETSARLNSGTAIVTDSILIKMALKTIHLVSPPPSPTRVFTSFDDARAWLSEKRGDASPSLPSASAP